MADETPLAGAIHSAVAEYLAGLEDPGMLTSFYFVMSVTTVSGDDYMQVAKPFGQPQAQTLGLVSWSDEFVRDDIRTTFLPLYDVDDE